MSLFLSLSSFFVKLQVQGVYFYIVGWQDQAEKWLEEMAYASNCFRDDLAVP